MQKVSLKQCQISSKLQGITTQKTTFIIVMNIWVCKTLGISLSCDFTVLDIHTNKSVTYRQQIFLNHVYKVPRCNYNITM